MPLDYPPTYVGSWHELCKLNFDRYIPVVAQLIPIAVLKNVCRFISVTYTVVFQVAALATR
jgi:hypothetical protein